MNDHERSDARIKPLVYSAVGLILVTLLAAAGMVWMFDFLQERRAAADPPRSPLSQGLERPAVPLLRAQPAQELEILRRREETFLTQYGWIDRDHGVARIPIQRAIDLLAEKGLTAVEPSPTDPPGKGEP